MTRQPKLLTKRRTGERRGFPARISTFAAVQTWAATTGLIELHAGGVHRWALTLPSAIIAVLDMCHELRTSTRSNDVSRIPSNYAEEVSEE
jgi:hypothetical protein